MAENASSRTMKKVPLLVVLAGAPGCGKSTVAARIAERLPALLVAVDPIEDAMYRSGVDREQPAGLAAYMVAEAVAEQNLLLGHTVVVDAVNSATEARSGQRDVAARTNTTIEFVEVVCSDRAEQERRLARRRHRFSQIPEPRWADALAAITALSYWQAERLVIDAADSGDSIDATLAVLEGLRDRH